MSGKRYVIIGDGAAGFTAAQTIRQNDPAALIRIFADDPNPAYFRAALTNYLIGELREEQIWAVPPTFYHEFDIDRIHARVGAVDSGRALLYMEEGGPAEPYDCLLIAAGSSAIRPAFPGHHLPGVMTMRTLIDVRQVIDLVRGQGSLRLTLRRAVIAGGGPLALEWVQGLHERGVQVTYLLRGAHLMARVLDKTASDLALARLRLAGVEVCLDEEINRAVAGKDGRLAAVETSSGRTIDCELAGVAFGVTGNTGFLASSGLALSPRQAVVVNDQMQTNVGNIFAAGDIVEWGGELRQLWEPARRQGRVAGENMAGRLAVDGRPAAYRPGVLYNATRLYDLDLASVGEVSSREKEKEREEEVFVDFPRGSGGIRYRKVVVRDGRVVGALLLGERKEQVRRNGRLFKRLIDGAVDVSAIGDRLLDPFFDLNGWLNTAVLTEKPEPAADPATLPSPAEMRKSRFLKRIEENPKSQIPNPNLQSPLSIHQLAVASAPAAPGRTLTSIGLGTQQLGRPRLPVGAVKAAVEYQGRRYEVAEASVVIGRDAECAIVLDDPAVSGHHAQLSYHSGDFYLRDLGSRNGTWANGRLVTVPHRLQPGDVIRLGQSEVIFRAEGRPVEQVQATAAAPPPRSGRLTVQDGSGRGVALGGRTLIGRDPACHLVVDDAAVSGIHLEILRQEDGFYALSRGRNGTVRRGERLGDRPVRLRAGDELTLGQAVIVFFEEE